MSAAVTAADLEQLVGPIELILHRGPYTAAELDQAAREHRLMVTHCGAAVVPLRLAWLDPEPPYVVCEECRRAAERERGGAR
ncbi:MAG: hypothetical protein JNL38_20620 [Myxococcales bacterium]|nr:hypothetical protein [Myxococcales bacterium]